MITFRLNFRIPNVEKERFINAFGLELIQDFTEEDTFFQYSNEKAEYLQNINGDSTYNDFTYDPITGVQKGATISIQKGSKLDLELELKKKILVVRWFVELYDWPGTKVRIEITHSNIREQFINVSVIADDQTALLAAKSVLNKTGFANTLLTAQGTIDGKRRSLWKDPLFFAILGVTAVLVIFFIFQSRSISQPTAFNSEKIFVFMQKQLTHAPLCSRDGACTYYHSLGKCGPDNENWIQLDEDVRKETALEEGEPAGSVGGLERAQCVCYRQRCVIQPQDELYIPELESKFFAP